VGYPSCQLSVLPDAVPDFRLFGCPVVDLLKMLFRAHD